MPGRPAWTLTANTDPTGTGNQWKLGWKMSPIVVIKHGKQAYKSFEIQVQQLLPNFPGVKLLEQILQFKH